MSDVNPTAAVTPTPEDAATQLRDLILQAMRQLLMTLDGRQLLNIVRSAAPEATMTAVDACLARLADEGLVKRIIGEREADEGTPAPADRLYKLTKAGRDAADEAAAGEPEEEEDLAPRALQMIAELPREARAYFRMDYGNHGGIEDLENTVTSLLYDAWDALGKEANLVEKMAVVCSLARTVTTRGQPTAAGDAPVDVRVTVNDRRFDVPADIVRQILDAAERRA